MYSIAKDTNQEYIDLNHSLTRLLNGPASKMPWKTLAPTLTSQPIIFMRQLDQKGIMKYKKLTGKDVMRLTGWATKFWIPPASFPEPLLHSLAGNAFSAFAAAPCVIALVATSTFQGPSATDSASGDATSMDGESGTDV